MQRETGIQSSHGLDGVIVCHAADNQPGHLDCRGSLFFLRPLRVGYVAQLATHVNLARAALATLPRDSRPAFLEQVNRQFDIKLVPIHPPYGEAMAPDREFPPPMQTSLRRMAGDDVDARMGNPEANEWIRFTAGGQPYWLIVARHILHFRPRCLHGS